ncbi:LURP-one-related/scramblase family protein [Lacticaseibacillus parakribbianus]|uniref:LURP-one-related/scramblase family protein n=1 Tax=Lacticaseibacillus parakribbianus TaxID=2970927 RepID=UPI0021CB42B6|nr:hypothetical protein [Lacticaseibacillus parakribbianus]
MDYYIDAQALHDGGMTVVKDAAFRPAFILNGRHGLANDGFNLHTIDGTHVGSIRQRTVGMFPRYDLYLSQSRVGSVKKMFGVWHEFVFVSDLNWMIIGNMLANNYRIYHGMKAVTTIAAVGAATGTTFKIAIKDQKDAPAGILLAAILDRWRQIYQANPLVRHDPASISYGV